MADAGRAHALAHHTYARRVELLLDGHEYDLGGSASDQRVVTELERADARQPLDHP